MEGSNRKVYPSCLLRIHEIGVPIGEIDSNTSRQGTILSMTHR
jgi:hypothetical protein